jgi:uncharacterized protein YebE (UPF0316 family)
MVMLGTLVSAVLVFLLRLMDVTLYTMRLLSVMRGRKWFAWGFAFCQSFVFVTVMRVVLSDLGNWTKVVGYAAGFATGMLLGMWIEARLPLGYTHLRIISPRLGVKIAQELRQQGFGVTEISAQGRDGMVTLLNCNVLRRYSPKAIETITLADPDAFITAESVRSVERGFWGK